MKDNDFGLRGESQNQQVQRNFDDKIQYLLSAEEQLLQAISVRAPLPELLDSICSALDCQIGNVVSLISLPGHYTSNLEEIGSHAALFGLHIFNTSGVIAENGEELGCLETYSCSPNMPSSRDFQLIERASCLAAIAIQTQKGPEIQGNCSASEKRPVRGHVLQWPVSMN